MATLVVGYLIYSRQQETDAAVAATKQCTNQSKVSAFELHNFTDTEEIEEIIKKKS